MKKCPPQGAPVERLRSDVIGHFWKARVGHFSIAPKPKADSEIRRFRTELSELPRGSALYERWYGLKQDLDRRFQAN